MAVLQLDASLLHRAITHASYTLISQREKLNAINVFPVADGDTGNNMAATAQAIIAHAKTHDSLYETCKSIANAAIIGARGNSGMIFSQFFNGFLEVQLNNSLTTKQFAAMIHTACQSVRAAIIKPVEGTILTVMEAWSASLSTHANEENDFLTLFKIAKKTLNAALENTTNTLTVLQEAKVVDAGALGFSSFIESFSAYIANPLPIDQHPELELRQAHQDLHDCGEPSTNRYCTEALLMKKDLSKAQLSQMLQAHGDSIVLTANKSLSRIHIHCEQPANVFDELRKLGQVQYPKVDDMQRQYDILHKQNQRIALVTDSSADLPAAWLDEFAIHLIPLNIQIDGHDLLDYYCIKQETFYQELENTTTYPTTSCPATVFIRDKIELLAEHYDEVLMISVAEALSGTYNAMVNAAKEFSNVHVVNSCHVSGSQGLLVYYAAQLIQQQKSISEIKEALVSKIAKTGFYVLVNQFDSLIRSGRVSKLKGRVAQFAGIKPILTLDKIGRAVISAKVFHESKALDKLITAVQTLTTKDGLQDYCIIHAGIPEKAQEFAKICTEAFGQPPLFIKYVSTAIGLHAGQGCIAIAAMSK